MAPQCSPSKHLGPELVTACRLAPPSMCPPVYTDVAHWIYSAPLCYREGSLSCFLACSTLIFHLSGAHQVTQPHSWSALPSQPLPSNRPGLFVHNWEINVNVPGWLRYTQVSPETGKKSVHSVCMREQPVLLHTDSPRTVSIQLMPKAKRLPCKTTGLCLWDFFMHYHFHLAAVGYKINVYINTVVESKRLFWRDAGIVL